MVVLIMTDPYIAAREGQAPQECLTLRGGREKAVKLRRKDHALNSQAMSPRGALQGFEMRENRLEVDREIPVAPTLVEFDSVTEGTAGSKDGILKAQRADAILSPDLEAWRLRQRTKRGVYAASSHERSAAIGCARRFER